jgi:hypothetical protein
MLGLRPGAYPLIVGEFQGCFTKTTVNVPVSHEARKKSWEYARGELSPGILDPLAQKRLPTPYSSSTPYSSFILLSTPFCKLGLLSLTGFVKAEITWLLRRGKTPYGQCNP